MDLKAPSSPLLLSKPPSSSKPPKNTKILKVSSKMHSRRLGFDINTKMEVEAERVKDLRDLRSLNRVQTLKNRVCP